MRTSVEMVNSEEGAGLGVTGWGEKTKGFVLDIL